MCIKGTTGTEPVKRLKIQTCYHCGRIIFEDPRGHQGCLNTKCRRISFRSKKIQPRTTKASEKIIK